MDTSIVDFNIHYYIAEIKNLALHLPHIKILELITVATHIESNSSVAHITDMCCAANIMQNV